MTEIQGLYTMAIVAIVVLIVWGLSIIATEPMDRFFVRHQHIAKFFNWFDDDDDIPRVQSDSEH